MLVAVMRPSSLMPLFASLTTLKGVGQSHATRLAGLLGERLVDFCWHLPVNVIDRRARPALTEIETGMLASFEVRVCAHKPPPRTRRRLPYRVLCENDTGTLTLIYFRARADWLQKLLPVGATRFVSGRVEHYRNQVQMTHPDYVLSPAEYAKQPALEPVYRLTQGIGNRMMLQWARQIMPILPALPEWIPAGLRTKHKWPDWAQALRQAHLAHGDNHAGSLDSKSPARQRLAFDELFANQLVRQLAKARRRAIKGRALRADSPRRAKILAALPFRLTQGQTRALAEIDTDLASAGRMHRLLQGDVGCGKTLVAFLAMLRAIDNGMQAALLAPTEILAGQHLNNFQTLCAMAETECAPLRGRDKGQARARTLRRLADGSLPMVVGTHALFEQSVQFRNLGLVVIDEQHRFGVEQRRALSAHDPHCNVLAMTATPIPRSLTLAAFGDMDISEIRDKPAQRRPIETSVMPQSRMTTLLARLRAFLDVDSRVYWVCPLVREDTEQEHAAVETRAKFLRTHFGDKVGLLHGQLTSDAKQAAQTAFAKGETQILVASSIVEVGLDIPQARVIVIDEAERFGLAQLHQLRGRVGRDKAQAYAVALYRPPLSDIAEQRLRLFRNSNDGFAIAEADLALRGAGDLLGTRQAGLPPFRLVTLGAHDALVALADTAAADLLAQDANLASPQGKAARLLLHLFEHKPSLAQLD